MENIENKFEIFWCVTKLFIEYIIMYLYFFNMKIGIYYGNVTENGTAGMMVMTMTAIDYDDVDEGTNAKLKYSIEKNVIDEHTGTPIFEIEEETGVIKTAVCCLDREKTPDYSIQVVAMDGGGLKGTYILWNFHGKNIVIFFS